MIVLIVAMAFALAAGILALAAQSRAAAKFRELCGALEVKLSDANGALARATGNARSEKAAADRLRKTLAEAERQALADAAKISELEQKLKAAETRVKLLEAKVAELTEGDANGEVGRGSKGRFTSKKVKNDA